MHCSSRPWLLTRHLVEQIPECSCDSTVFELSAAGDGGDTADDSLGYQLAFKVEARQQRSGR